MSTKRTIFTNHQEQATKYRRLECIIEDMDIDIVIKQPVRRIVKVRRAVPMQIDAGNGKRKREE